MPDFSKDSFNPAKQFTSVQFGSESPLLEVELNELQDIQSHARAEILRKMVHSGVLDHEEKITTYFYGDLYDDKGRIKLPEPPTYYPGRNTIRITEFDVIVNGHKFMVEGFQGETGHRYNSVTLPDPPHTGTREDLVFLEAWFDQIDATEDASIKDSRLNVETSRRKKINYRLRAHAGVDFSRNKRGFVEWGNDWSITPVSAQGGNAAPIVRDANNMTVVQFHAVNQDDDVGFVNPHDAGLFIAGNGTQASKDLLKTTDGYVYAIPLFRVKRRNSGGYSAHNLNGANLYVGTSTKADFTGKVSGSVTSNPHIAKWNDRSESDGTALLAPNGTWSNELDSTSYGKISSLNGSVETAISTINGGIGQNLFSFNIIEEVERKLGKIPGSTKAQKIQWLKNNLNKIATKWHGSGSSPAGNKATLKVWENDMNRWDATSYSHSNSVVSTITINTSSSWIGKTIDTSGFVHFLAYAEPSDGTTASVINTDYIELEVSLSPYATLDSERPDGKLANIISPADIIDLRHKVSLTGENPQRLLEETFDKLLRGQLDTYAKEEVVKNRLGLEKAPNDTPVYLAPKLVRGNDGVSRSLVNLLGEDGNMEDTSKWVGYQGSLALDASNKLYGNNAMRFTISATVGAIYKANTAGNRPSLKSGKYYLFMGNVKNGNALDVKVKAALTGTPSVVTDGVTFSSTAWNTSYLKLNPTVDDTVSFEVEAKGVSGQYVYADGLRIYEIDQATYDKINVDPAFTGEELVKKFPYVSSYPNVAENLLPPFTEWTLHANAKLLNPYELELTSTTAVSDSIIELNNLISGQVYHISSGSAERNAYLSFYSSSGSVIEAGFRAGAITIPVGTVKTRIAFGNAGGAGTFRFNNPMLTPGNVAKPFVPHGKWFLPDDYIEGKTPTRVSDFYLNPRLSFSEVQTSETRTDVVEALKTPQKHIQVTQATAGTWANGSTIKVKSLSNGVITGVIDSDTAIARVVQSGTNVTTVFVDDVSKLAVNDVINILKLDGTLYYEKQITAIDTTYKTISFGGAIYPEAGMLIVETTTSSSAPIVTAAGIAGTWSGLGTREATYTISTPPTATTGDIKIQYAVNYPAGNGLEKLPEYGLNATTVNGHKLTRSYGNTILKDDFTGKVVGSTDANPHVVKYGADTSLLAPASASFLETVQTRYDQVKLLDGVSYPLINSGSGSISQQLFSFDLIELVQRKFGEGFFADCATVAEKVAKLKTQLTNITANWHGFGSSPTGNKASFRIWDNGGSGQWGGSFSHTSAVVTKLTQSVSNISLYIDSNGFTHFLVFADASNGTTASIINTDYIDISVELNHQESGYAIYAPENSFPVFTTDPNYKEGENIIPPFTSGAWTLHNNSKVLSATELETSTEAAWQYSTVAFRVMPEARYHLSFTPSNDNGWIRTRFVAQDGTLIGSEAFATGVITAPANAYTMEIGLYNVNANAATVVFRNVMLTPGISARPYVPGVKKSRKKNLFTFVGKKAGDTFENPHKYFATAANTFAIPPFGTEAALTSQYENLAKRDGSLRGTTTAVSGAYSQQLFEFDLSHLGLSLKELKAACRKLSFSWTGYGVGDNAGVLANGATLKTWIPNYSTPMWSNSGFYSEVYGANTSSTPTTISKSYNNRADLHLFINNDQKVYVMAHATYPAGTASQSEIHTDFIKLEVELADYVDIVKSNVVKLRKETKEVKLAYPPVSYRYGNAGVPDCVEYHYATLPQPEILPTGSGYYEVTVLAESDGFLVSDLSTAMALKQGYHHYMNPLYRVAYDTKDVFGDFGFANVPFSADTKGANIGALIGANANGITGPGTNQYGIPVIKRPMVGMARYLVKSWQELKMLVIVSYSSNGDLSARPTAGTAFMVPLVGNPLVKMKDGTRKSSYYNPTAWRTPSGEIQGYLNAQGQIIATYQ